MIYDSTIKQIIAVNLLAESMPFDKRIMAFLLHCDQLIDCGVAILFQTLVQIRTSQRDFMMIETYFMFQ